MWLDFTDPSSQKSLSEKEAEMHHFVSYEQRDLVKPYKEKFFSNLHEMYKSNSYKWFEAYFHSLLPREQVIEEADISRLRSIKTEYQNSPDGKKAGRNDGFIKTLDGGIDSLIRSKKLRAFAQQTSKNQELALTAKKIKEALKKGPVKKETPVLTEAELIKSKIENEIQKE